MATKRKRLIDEYRFPGFEPRDDIHGIFGDPMAWVIPLVRRSKKRSARTADECTRAGGRGWADHGRTESSAGE